MGFIVILPIGILAAWSIVATTRRLRRGAYPASWWRAFVLLGGGGILLGVWFAFFLQYNVANVHLAGFPIPVDISSRQKSSDTEPRTAMPSSIRCGGLITDFLSGVALCLAPIAVAAFLKENRGKLGAPEIPPGRPTP